jgi:hypothetical protein
MARTGDELDAAAFEVVVGIVEGMDFEFAGIAGSGIDLADGQRAAEDAQDLVVQAIDLALRTVRAGRCGRCVGAGKSKVNSAVGKVE